MSFVYVGWMAVCDLNIILIAMKDVSWKMTLLMFHGEDIHTYMKCKHILIKMSLLMLN